MPNRTKTSFIILLLLCFLFISGFVVLAHEVVVEKEDWFDTRVFVFLNDHIDPSLINLFKVFTFFGSIGFIVSAFALVTLWLVLIRRKKDAIAVGITGIITGLLVEIFKLFFQRSRPDIPLLAPLHNYSFPSGHAFSAFIFYSILSLIIWKTRWPNKWKILSIFLLFVFILAIGISRIVLRYHYASDVVGGFCLGGACLAGYLAYKIKR